MAGSTVFNLKIVAGWLALFSGIFITAYFIPRSNFAALSTWMGLSFAGYAILISARKKMTLGSLFFLAILVRLSLLFANPELSDDIYRFVWDGRILANGGNPYLYQPADMTAEQMASFDLSLELKEKLNSPSYFTVYPPLNQLAFATASLIGKGSFQTEIMVLKLLILLSEGFVLFLLFKIVQKMGKRISDVALYAFNPLVIIELCGNLHFEGVELLFLLLSLYLCLSERITIAGLVFGLAVSIKLLPLMFLPFLLNPLGWRKALTFGLSTILVFFGLFLPFLSSQLVTNFWSSLDLYFRSFEFNASVYFIVREIGHWIKGYNIIQTAGPILTISTGLIILVFAFQRKILRGRLLERVLFALLLYFLLATTVHPWYLVLLVAVSVLAPWKFPLWWSASVFLSYAFYNQNRFEIASIWLWLEYSVLFVALFWELFAQNKFRRFLMKSEKNEMNPRIE